MAVTVARADSARPTTATERAAFADTTVVCVVPSHSGRLIHPGIRGQCPYRQITPAGYEVLWALTAGASGRGVAGGLDADTYDWRNIQSGSNWGLGGGAFTTLEFLRYARDSGAWPMITANLFGGGSKAADGTFVCQTDHPERLAADWVRYTNRILQQYREGDQAQLAGEDLRVLESITGWEGRPRLLSPEEPPVPIVEYWEIGNEPEVPGIGTMLSNHYLGPEEYRDRYRSMAEAMLAVDCTLRLGPCLTSPADNPSWLDALLNAVPPLPIDFVAFHPYYSGIKAAWGDPALMGDRLRDYKSFLRRKIRPVRTLLDSRGRADCELAATEWNPLNWDATSQQQRSMAMALGLVEGVFTFAEEGLTAAHFWEQPQSKPCAVAVFSELRDHMGDTLLAGPEAMGFDPSQIHWRLYATTNRRDRGTLMIWGLNFDDGAPLDVSLCLDGCAYAVRSGVVRRYGKPGEDGAGGDTALMLSSGMAWSEEVLAGSLGVCDLRLRLEDAEITVAILNIVPWPFPDMDRDGDVDVSDFRGFQYCYNGPDRPPAGPECDVADYDRDADVDISDFAVFQACFNGPAQAAACLDTFVSMVRPRP